MYRIDDNQNVASLPADPTDNVGTPGYFTGGNPSAGIPPTRVRYWWLNMIQEELCNLVTWDGTALVKDNYTQVLSAIRRMFRTRVIGGTLTFYVSTAGSDSNDGLSAATPLLTVNQAITLAAENYDLTGTTIQIILAAGTYGAVTVNGNNIRAPVSIVGAGSSSTTITSAVSASIYVVNGANCSLSGITLTNTTPSAPDYSAGNYSIISASGGSISIGSDINFGSNASGAHMWAYDGGRIGAVSQGSGAGRNYTISGGGSIHYRASVGGSILLPDSTVTIIGTPNFTGAFAVVDVGGLVSVYNNTYSGSATGGRYSAVGNGVIQTNGGGATYLPGNSAGSTSAGGQYY